MFVIFGAAGDLTTRPLVSTLYTLAGNKLSPDGFKVIGVDRSAHGDDDRRRSITETMQSFSRNRSSESHIPELDGVALYRLDERMQASSGWRTRLSDGTVPGMTTVPNPYRSVRFPAEVIEHAVRLYHCFSHRLRDVETIHKVRGVVASCESIREWGLRFGRLFASKLKRRRPRPGGKSHFNAVFLGIRSNLHYLWRAVDQHGNVLKVLVQGPRTAGATKRFVRTPLKGLQDVARVLVTDKLRCYAAAKQEVLPGVEHRHSRYLNNRFPQPASRAVPPGDHFATVSHQPTRRGERQMQRFKPARHARRLLSAHSQIYNQFTLRRRLIADQCRAARDAAFRTWHELVGLAAMA